MARLAQLTAVIAAMREAGGNKERFTAGWIELSCTHKGLHDALKAVFKCKPTAQRLGLWLSENVGAESGEFVLLGRHSTNAKAWRYAVRKPGEVEELKAAKEAAKAPPPVVVRVQAPEPEPERAIVSIHNPYMVEGALAPDHLTTTRMTSDGKIHHDLVLGRDGMPVAAVPETRPEPPPDAIKSRNPLMPPWRLEGRQPTRAEWDWWQKTGRHAARNDNSNMPESSRSGPWADVGGIVAANIIASRQGPRGQIGGCCHVAGHWPGGRKW